MKCNPALLSAFVDGQLTDHQDALVRRHVAVCQLCAARVAGYRSVGSAVRGMEPARLPSRLAAFDPTLQPLARPRPMVARQSSVVPSVVAAAIIGFGIALAGFALMIPASPQPERPVVAFRAIEQIPINVPKSARIELEFPEPFDRTVIEQSLSIDPPIPADFQWRDNRLVIEPRAPLAPATTYTVRAEPAGTAPASGGSTPPALAAFQTAAQPTPPARSVAAAPTATTAPAAVPTPSGGALADAAVSAATSTATPPPAGGLPPAGGSATATVVPPTPTIAPPTATPAVAATPAGGSSVASTAGGPTPTATAAPVTVTPVPPIVASPVTAPTRTATPEPTQTRQPTPIPMLPATATRQPTQTQPPAPTPVSCAVQAEVALRALGASPLDAALDLGCSLGIPVATAGSVQLFQRGVLLWQAAPARVYILHNGGRWTSEADTWTPVQPTPTVTATAPPGLSIPVERFGSVWAERQLGNSLGWARTGERTMPLRHQLFEHGTVIAADQVVFVLFADGTWIELPRRTGP